MQITALSRGQARARDAIRHHLGVAQDRRPGFQRGDAGQDRARGEGDVGSHLDHSAGMDDSDRDPLFLGREALQIGLGADDGERTAVNLRAVLDIILGFGHAVPPCVLSAVSVADARPLRPASAPSETANPRETPLCTRS